MKDLLLSIKDDFSKKINSTNDVKELENIRVEYLGKKGHMTEAMKQMGKLSKEEKPVIGKLANEVSTFIKDSIESKKVELEADILNKKLEDEIIDISLETNNIKLGAHHPLLKTLESMEDFFSSMGYKVVPGPEIESVENNFDLLNSPEDHPTRDKSDTFYIDPEIILRTHTSPTQIRAMKKYGAPIKMVSNGRVFRVDEVDATHSPMFHQMEGLVVGEGITMANLIDTLETFIRDYLGEDLETRYRPHYFPFTEPSLEVDVTCPNCGGKGCNSCGHTGWSMELLGGGMVHPNVLRNCGIDPEKYSGFAFGLGVDRIAMVKYQIPDIRLLFENDKRFLEQF